MNTELIGKTISEQRKKLGYTQEQLAEMLNVSAQAVSKWENGHNLPDIENLVEIADILKIPFKSIVEHDGDGIILDFRNRLFHENNMYTRVKTIAHTETLKETLRALDFMREKHSGQFRKERKFTAERIAYINHPLMMACHAHAMGIKDDAILSAILLHDVVEDTDVTLDRLPFSDEVKEIVDLVTFKQEEGKTKEECKAAYYEAIMENKKACVVKIIDRCNNVSTMAGCFSNEKLIEYIDETERYIIPLIDKIKDCYAEYSDVAFIVKYQIISLIESIKALMQ